MTRANPTANYMRWTNAQDKHLTRMYVEQNMSHKDMAEILGRTTWAIGARITAIDLTPKKRAYQAKKGKPEPTTTFVPTSTVKLHKELSRYQFATYTLSVVSLALVGAQFIA